MYICLDRNDLETMAPLVRLLFGRMMATIMRSEPDREKEPYPIMFMIDEFTQLGKMKVVADSIDVIRSFGGRMMLIAQNLPKLDVIYTEDGRKSLMAGAGAKLYLTPNEDKTGDHISKTAGKWTKKRTSHTRKSQFDIVSANHTASESYEAADLITPAQAMLLDEEKVIVMMRGQHPIKAFRNKYYEDPFLNKMFESQEGPLPDPINIYARFEAQPDALAREADIEMAKGADPQSAIDAVDHGSTIDQENDWDAVSAEENLSMASNKNSSIADRLDQIEDSFEGEETR